MAAHAAAALLDELMGRNRNLHPTESKSTIRWDDGGVCKYYLVSFCPHDLFVNTKADLGPCTKLHDDNLKNDYEKSGRYEKMGFEDDFIRFLQGMINDVERRIKRGHQRLNLNSLSGQTYSSPTAAKEEKIAVLTERVNDLVQEAENLGCEGKVEEAQGVMKLVEQLTEERTQLENQAIETSMPAMKEMEVCSVCGAFLIVGDAKQRAEEHLMGKQHMGYARVRKYVADFAEGKRQKEVEREQKWIKEREDREKEREKEREERNKKREEREREREDRRKSRSRGHRSRSREHRHRSRSRERRRSRDKRRSRSRDRSSRDHKHSRSHSADRSSSRSHNRKHDGSKSREPSTDKTTDANGVNVERSSVEDNSVHDHETSIDDRQKVQEIQEQDH